MAASLPTALGMLFVAAVALAQSPSAMPRLSLDRATLQPDSLVFLDSATGNPQPGSGFVQRFARVVLAGAPAVLQVTTERSLAGDVVVVDSIWVDSATLLARRHRRHDPNSTVVLEFEGRRIHGFIRSGKDSTVMISENLPAPAFDGGVTDLLLRALPLTRGLRLTFPIYTVGLGHSSFQVLEIREVICGKDDSPCWSIDTLYNYQPTTFQIAASGGELVEVVIHVQHGRPIRMVRAN